MPGSNNRNSSSSKSSSTTTSENSHDHQQYRRRPKAVFLNAGRLNYDDQLDFRRWHELCHVALHPTDNVHDPAQVLELVHDAEIVITKEMNVPVGTFAMYPDSVQLLCEAGTGYNNLPIQQARDRGIDVCNVPTYSTEAVAHMAITYLMNLSVRMFDQQRMLWENNRSNFTGPFTLPLHEINGKTLGLVGGSGRIGTKVGEIGLALGMHVIISSRRGSLPKSHELYGHAQVECTADVNYLLRQSDYVSLHTPLNAETRETFGRTQIEQMKPTAFLINTSRGAVCIEDELIACMKEGRIAGAGLDVTTTEPPAPDSELWNLPNVWLSPHTGWRRIETRQRLVDMTADNIAAYCQGQPINVDN